MTYHYRTEGRKTAKLQKLATQKERRGLVENNGRRLTRVRFQKRRERQKGNGEKGGNVLEQERPTPAKRNKQDKNVRSIKGGEFGSVQGRTKH